MAIRWEWTGPWNLDAIPLVIPPSEWSQLEAGLIQRARLLNLILADLYGPQQLLHGGLIPPALVFANPGFWRPCHGVRVAGNTYLHLLAVDLARGPDGDWWVISDRTQAPSGAGYSLENRIVMAETFPDLFREFQVKRLASFFRSFRDKLLRLSPVHARQSARRAADARSVQRDLLRAFLSRALSRFHAGSGRRPDRARQPRVPEDARRAQAGGRHSAPRGRWFLRSRSNCAPILSRRGRAGGSGASGQRTVANALGSGLIETSAFMPFFPGLSRRMLGEELKLPTAATWWCGQPEALRYVLDNLDSLVIKPAFPSKGMEPVFGGRLGAEERSRLIARIKESPHEFAGQELLNLSTAPVWSEEHGLTPRRVVFARVPGGEGRLVGRNSGRPGARFPVDRYAGRLDAARRRQQGHLGSFRRAGGYFQFAAAARRARRIESRGCERSAQPRRRPHFLAGPLCRALRASGAHAAMHSDPADRPVGSGGRTRMGIADEDARMSGISTRAAIEKDEPDRCIPTRCAIWNRKFFRVFLKNSAAIV